ncbi:MAG TPA: hypothetical protein VH044_01950 [Polyangiaceae bacterium]|jgi:hypothetical protein|nr:hypothetical protein [Polyangiaceae bacterium]
MGGGKVGFRALGVAVASALALLWATSGTQRERPLLGGVTGDVEDVVRAREADAAARPDDPQALRALAQVYLDAQQSGLAVAALEAAPASLRADARTQHLYARALLDQGRNDDALAVEARVVAACMPGVTAVARETPATREARDENDDASRDVSGDLTGCDALLLVQALRRQAILRELVALGVEDTRAHPEESFVAYQNATREARVAAF